MTEDVVVGIINRFFEGGWRIAPFIKTADGYIGVKGWPKRAATNLSELQTLVDERQGKSSRKLLYGVVPPRGRYVVDIDIKKNTSALTLWRDKVIETYTDASLASPNLIVKTKSGGYHLYYFDGSDRQLHSPTSVFGKDSGIDIRGYTGMVVMPSSIGTEADWSPGEYVVVRGDPSQACTVLSLGPIIGVDGDETDSFVRDILFQLNEVLRNDTVQEAKRHRLIPDNLILPEGNRDNIFYRAARLCRLAGIAQESAIVFMQYLATRCEVSAEEPLEHWQKLAAEKVRRVYADADELKLTSISQLYEELNNAGTVLLRGVSKSYYYFRHGSPILRIEPRSRYATDNIPNILAGKNIEVPDGDVPIRKIIPSYEPKDVAYNAAMYPRSDMPFFSYEGQTYVNTYYDQFASFEPSDEMMARAAPFIDLYKQFTLHIVGGNEADAEYLTRKLAWIVQKPYRRLPTATMIYSFTRGSGKDIFMSLFREVIGRKYFLPMSIDSLNNPHFAFHDKIVCVASEVQQQANARGTIATSGFMGRIKDLITAKDVSVNEKFQQPFTAPLFAQFFLLSNYEPASYVEPSDRRFDVFHATEEKLHQPTFGVLADITNDGIWLDRSASDRLLRQHVIFSLRDHLLNIEVAPDFDRQEARINEVKLELFEQQAPPAMVWLYENLPLFFTEEVVILAAHFCPHRIVPEYALRHLKEYYAANIRPIYRESKQIFRISGAPVIELRDNGGKSMPVLSFTSANNKTRKPVLHFANKGNLPAPPGEAWIKADLKRWYDGMMAKYHGNLMKLPGQENVS